MTPTPPNLVEAAKAMMEYDETTDCSTPESGGWQSVGLSDAFDGLRQALAALPSDAVVVSRKLIEDASDAIVGMDAAIASESGTKTIYDDLAAKLREACR